MSLTDNIIWWAFNVSLKDYEALEEKYLMMKWNLLHGDIHTFNLNSDHIKDNLANIKSYFTYADLS